MARHRSAGVQAGTDVILATFRAHGLLLAAGGELAATEGLTAARWQTLGALALAGRPLTVPQIGRRMGLTRQSVHATVDRLLAEGLVERVANADHQRSSLVRLTPDGARRYTAMERRQTEWVTGLVAGLSTAELHTTARVLAELCRRLGEGRDHHGE